ncbi:MAG: DUF4236 domain-containing protein [Oscillospiraceae bacterium]|jgi:hypothetical protein|nr:DUF4236 domain-containing protein [Oscillospiraceae bacterium]
MSLRFRKSINLGHGVRLNIGKKGVGISAGVKGARVSINSSGRKTTSVGIPGTGVSYVKSEKIGAPTKVGNEAQSKFESQDLLPDNNNTPPTKKKPGCLPIVLGIVAVVCVIGFIDWAAHGFPATNSSSSAASSALLTSSISEISSTATSSEAVSSEESNSAAESSKPSSTLGSSTPKSSAPAETSKPAAAASQKLTVTSAPGTVSKGSIASISIKGKPNAQYSIAVHYASGVSKANGLESKTSDANGNATWSWKIGIKTKSGTYDVIISDGTDEIDSSVTIS